MTRITSLSRKFAGITGLLFVAGAAMPVQAQTKHSWFHRHPTATTAGAGVGAYALARHSKHGIFHRHPVATGIGAALIAHHYAKKHKR